MAKQYLAFYFLLVSVLAISAEIFQIVDRPATVETTQEKQNDGPLPEREYTSSEFITAPRCGSVLTGTTGEVLYKPFDTVVPNERCVWILGVPNAYGYKIDLMHLGRPTNVPGSDQRLVFTSAELKTAASLPSPALRTHIPTSTGYFNVSHSNTVIVTFYSNLVDSADNIGFAFRYEAIMAGGNITRSSAASAYHLLESPTIELRHPTTGRYSNNELSLFVFFPPNNIRSGGQSHVWYNLNGLEGSSCFDTLSVYKLDVDEESLENGIWSPYGSFCGNVTSVYIPNDDVTLITFMTDTADVSNGFWLSYTAC